MSSMRERERERKETEEINTTNHHESNDAALKGVSVAPFLMIDEPSKMWVKT